MSSYRFLEDSDALPSIKIERVKRFEDLTAADVPLGLDPEDLATDYDNDDLEDEHE